MIAFLIWGQIFVLCIAGLLNVSGNPYASISFGLGAIFAGLMAALSWLSEVRRTR